MMNSRQFLYILIITFVTIMIWVASDIWHSRASVTIPEDTQKLIEDVNPTFDTRNL